MIEQDYEYEHDELLDDDDDYDDVLAEVPVAWEALEDAFENNAHEVHSYLHLETGEVIRVVDGIADPAMHNRIMGDRRYLRVDPVSSREQYRWMERFIVTVTNDELRNRLSMAIDGKGAFRRFKDALMHHPGERERWFSFRSERLRANMESWLNAHGIRAIERPQWPVPQPEPLTEEQAAEIEATAPEHDVSRVKKVNDNPDAAQRQRLHNLIDKLPSSELKGAESFLEFAVARASSVPDEPKPAKRVEPVVTSKRSSEG